MGHFTGPDMNRENILNAVGGTYDRQPEIYENVLEREYAKLEPYINIYSSAIATKRMDPLIRDIEQLTQLPGGREFFSSIVDDAKDKLAKMLRLQKIE